VKINGLKVVFYESSSEPGPRLHSRLSGTRRTGTPNFGVSSFVSSFSFVFCDFRLFLKRYSVIFRQCDVRTSRPDYV